MECHFCHSEMKLLSQRYKVRSSENKEIQYICPVCHYTVVIKDGLQSWYDENDRPVHGSHDCCAKERIT